MPELKLGELAQMMKGEVIRGDADTVVDAFGIDSRTLPKRGAFFALATDKADGHEFLSHAKRRGAAVAIIHRAPGKDGETPPALIRVEDTVVALTEAARQVRKSLKDARWLAVTGSNGKTTTKELLTAGLAATHRVHQTQGNFNNHLGVPLSILDCPADAERVVLELAMNHAGEIAHLTELADPDIGLVTNVRAVHLANFNSLDDIGAAKGELFAVLRKKATSVVNVDDPQIRVQSTRHDGPRVTFGRSDTADLRLATISATFEGSSFSFHLDGKEHRVALSLGGGHAAFDALAALACVHAAGDDLEAAIENLATVRPGPGRGKVHHLARDVTVVDDTYNSSPAALASVLETLRNSRPKAGRKVLVMGDMLELGAVEGALHREAGKRAASAGVQMLVAVGPLSRQSAESARRAGVPEVHLHPESRKCAQGLSEYIREGDLVVVKGSRGMRMDRVVEALLTEFKAG